MQKIVLGFVAALIALTLYSLIDIIASSDKKPEPSVSSVTPPASAVAEPSGTTSEAVSVQEKKKRFIEAILPAVNHVKEELDSQYAKAIALSSKPNRTPSEKAWLNAMKTRYHVDGIPCLLKRLHTHPVSLVIAQAALETGWGTSRFFKEANNLFGIWSYHKDEPRIAASKQRGEKTIYLKKFASYEDAVRGYFKMVASGYAYNDFRKARMRTDNPFELLRHLRRYSELRDEYVARLYYVIKANKLYRYDNPSFEPVALATIVPEYVAMKAKEKAQKEQLVALNEVKVESVPTGAAKPCEEETAPTPRAPVPAKEGPEGSSAP